MNRSTFGQAVSSRISSLANEIEEDNDDDREIKAFRGNVEGEEDDSNVKYDEEDGTAIEPFNLKSDREAGYFDENMNFVFKKESLEVDSWLANMNETEMERAIGEAAQALKKKNERIGVADKFSKTQQKSLVELKVELMQLMLPLESVAAAMRRYSNHGKVKEISHGGNKKRLPPSAAMDVTTSQADKAKNKAILDQVTDIANELLSRGITSVYQMTYEAIDASISQWEYRGQDGTMHGPFTSQQIAAWKAQGYFTGDTAVMMRRIVSATTSRKRGRDNDLADDLVNDLDSDDDIGASDKQKHSVVVEKKMEWILSDDIDFGDPNDIPINEADDSKNRRIDVPNREDSRRVQFKAGDEEEDDDEDPDIDGAVNRRSRRRRLNTQDGNEEEDEDDD